LKFCAQKFISKRPYPAVQFPDTWPRILYTHNIQRANYRFWSIPHNNGRLVIHVHCSTVNLEYLPSQMGHIRPTFIFRISAPNTLHKIIDLLVMEWRFTWIIVTCRLEAADISTMFGEFPRHAFFSRRHFPNKQMTTHLIWCKYTFLNIF
jgi:hypothetical protein